MKLITFNTNDDGITINIPTELMIHVAMHNPNESIKILDKNKFMQQLAYELEHNLGDAETGATGLQELLDKACEEIYENGHDSVSSY